MEQLNPIKTYPSIFSKGYWIDALSEFKSLKKIVFIAILTSLRIVVGFFYIPLLISLRIYFSFIVTAITALIFGPIVGLISGGVADLLGFVIMPSGPFFIGYTISAMLSGFIFGLLLYHQKISIFKIILSKTLINVLVNIFLGSLWSFIIYDQGYLYYLSTSVIKNLALLPIEVLILIVLIKKLIQPFQTMNLISKDIDPHFKFF